MSFLTKILGRGEQRSSWFGPTTWFPPTAAPAGAQAAENLATVVACINAIATGIGTLPATVYRAEGEGRIEAPNHPVSRLIRSPNGNQTWADWIEWTLSQVLLHGNSLSAIQMDGAGRPTALIPIPWANVSVQMLPGGRLAYDVVAYQSPWGGTGTPRRLLADEVFHLRDRSDDGVLGRSRISRAPAVLASAIGVQTYSSHIWQNAATPSGMVELPPGITPQGMARMKAHFEAQAAGAENGKRILFVDPATKFTPLSISPEDAEVLESRRFSVIELCRLFGVPPPIVQDYSNSTFTNASQASTWFATNTLTPWARKIEAEFARSVFADPNGAFHLEIDLSGLVRGDYATRWTANVAAVQAGILTRDEVRAQEGYGPLPAASATQAKVQQS
ncbi:MAG: phage portal protein [Rhodospirillales bacterium]|nr:phage portal protein [Rhodospirillales bacterium]